MQAYCKEHHPAGPAWDPQGADAAAFQPGGGAGSGGAAPKAPPAAPPPPPPGFFDEAKPVSALRLSESVWILLDWGGRDGDRLRVMHKLRGGA